MGEDRGEAAGDNEALNGFDLIYILCTWHVLLRKHSKAILSLFLRADVPQSFPDCRRGAFRAKDIL